jgi:hypothetical protein
LIPKTISEALARQKLSVLYEVRDLLEQMISEMERPLSPEDMPSGREIVKEKKAGAITYRLEKVSCGKGCRGCPHGPYWYGYWKEDGKTRSKYIGKRLA